MSKTVMYAGLSMTTDYLHCLAMVNSDRDDLYTRLMELKHKCESVNNSIEDPETQIAIVEEARNFVKNYLVKEDSQPEDYPCLLLSGINKELSAMKDSFIYVKH